MEQHFDPQVAQKIGIEKAVILHQFAVWITKNMANRENFHEGNYWTCNSARGLTKLFPYMSLDVIKRHLHALVDMGILSRGNFNRNRRDRTYWYAITPEGWKLISPEKESAAAAPGTRVKKNDLEFITDEKRRKIFEEWVNYKKSLGRPYKTRQGLEKAYVRLARLAGDDPDKMGEIINQSIANEWQGLFGLKADRSGEDRGHCSAIRIPSPEEQGGSSTI